MNDIKLQKKDFRKKVKEVVTKFCKDELLCKECEKSAFQTFTASDVYKQADVIFCYMAMWDEISVSKIIEQAIKDNKKVALPKIDNENSVMDFYFVDSLNNVEPEKIYGILEPNSICEKVILSELKGNVVILVPGRAFNLHGERIGRGKGFYDKFLSQLSEYKNSFNLKVCGVSYSVQITKDFPVEETDYKMEYLLCEYGITKVHA